MASDDRLRDRIDREKRAQTRGRIARSALRWTTLIGGLTSFGLMGLSTLIDSIDLGAFGCCLMLPTGIAFLALFLMGGWAPPKVRARLTERERDILDN